MSARQFSILTLNLVLAQGFLQCPQRCPYTFTTIHHRVSHDFTSIESLDAYTVQYYILLCFKTYRGTMYYYCSTLWTGFYPPDLCLSTCKECIVRYNIICCVSKHSYYYCTVFVDSFSPSTLSSVQETPWMSAGWKTMLKQVY